MAGATSYDSGDPGSLELPAKCIEKTYDYNATRPSGKPKKILKSPELKNANTYKKKHDLAGSYFSYLS